METNFEQHNNQPNTPQKNNGIQIGPGQIVYTNFTQAQNRADFENQEEKEDKYGMKTITEANNENIEDHVKLGNDTGKNMRKDEEITIRESEGNEMKKKKVTQNVASSKQEQSQKNIMVVPEDAGTMFNPLEGDQDDEKPLEITARQAKGLATIMASNSIIEASRISGIPERTLRRWITDPTFKLAFREEIERIKQGYVLETLSLLRPSLQARRDLLENPTQPGAAIKEKVADKTIRSCEKSLEMISTEERLERLERLVRHHDKTKTR